MCAVIVIDDGINFKDTFQKMCEALKTPIVASQKETIK